MRNIFQIRKLHPSGLAVKKKIKKINTQAIVISRGKSLEWKNIFFFWEPQKNLKLMFVTFSEIVHWRSCHLPLSECFLHPFLPPATIHPALRVKRVLCWGFFFSLSFTAYPPPFSIPFFHSLSRNALLWFLVFWWGFSSLPPELWQMTEWSHGNSSGLTTIVSPPPTPLGSEYV